MTKSPFSCALVREGDTEAECDLRLRPELRPEEGRFEEEERFEVDKLEVERLFEPRLLVLRLLVPWAEPPPLSDAFNALGEFREELSPPSGGSGSPWRAEADVGLCSEPRDVPLFIPNEFKLLSGAGRRPASGLSPLSIDICLVASSSRVAICQPRCPRCVQDDEVRWQQPLGVKVGHVYGEGRGMW